MKPEITAAVVMLICLGGALAALTGNRPQTDKAKGRESPWWRISALCCFALAVAIAVLYAYRH